MEEKLRNLYYQFLDYHQMKFVEDRKFWFGVKEANLGEKEMKEVFLKYEIDSFYHFCKRIKDIIFAKDLLKEVQAKWCTDSWPVYYYIDFLKQKKILDIKKNGKIVLVDKEFLNFFPRPLSEEETIRIIEKKLKTKLFPNKPSNFLFGGETKAKYDQLPISTSSAIFLVVKILEYFPVYKKFLFVGDDDLVSLYLSLANEKIESVVIDIDDSLLKKIKKFAQKFNLKIETKKIDIFKTKKISEKFVGFLTSPVYTFEGTRKFLDFGINQLGEDGGFVFLNLADEAIGNRYIFLEEFFFQKNLKIEEIVKEKLFYPWRITHPEDKIIYKRFKSFFTPQKIRKSPLISSALWVFEFIPFKIPRPKKQPFYAYL